VHWAESGYGWGWPGWEKLGRACTGMRVGMDGAGQVVYKESRACTGMSAGTAECETWLHFCL
jgi:hypothetical protein